MRSNLTSGSPRKIHNLRSIYLVAGLLLVVLGAVLAGGAAGASATPAAQVECDVENLQDVSATITPKCGPLGTTFRLTAFGFQANEPLTLRYIGPEGNQVGTANPIPGGHTGRIENIPIETGGEMFKNGIWAAIVEGATSGHQATARFRIGPVPAQATATSPPAVTASPTVSPVPPSPTTEPASPTAVPPSPTTAITLTLVPVSPTAIPPSPTTAITVTMAPATATAAPATPTSGTTMPPTVAAATSTALPASPTAEAGSPTAGVLPTQTTAPLPQATPTVAPTRTAAATSAATIAPAPGTTPPGPMPGMPRTGGGSAPFGLLLVALGLLLIGWAISSKAGARATRS